MSSVSYASEYDMNETAQIDTLALQQLVRDYGFETIKTSTTFYNKDLLLRASKTLSASEEV